MIVMRTTDRFSKRQVTLIQQNDLAFYNPAVFTEPIVRKQINSVCSVKARGGKKRVKSYSQKMQIPDGAKKNQNKEK